MKHVLRTSPAVLLILSCGAHAQDPSNDSPADWAVQQARDSDIACLGTVDAVRTVVWGRVWTVFGVKPEECLKGAVESELAVLYIGGGSTPTRISYHAGMPEVPYVGERVLFHAVEDTGMAGEPVLFLHGAPMALVRENVDEADSWATDQTGRLIIAIEQEKPVSLSADDVPAGASPSQISVGWARVIEMYRRAHEAAAIGLQRPGRLVEGSNPEDLDNYIATTILGVE